VTRRPVTARNRHNIVLTGPPRSGTTMSVYLLHKSRNTVALDEPMQPGKKLYRFMPDKEAVCDGIEKYYRRTRRMIRKEGRAVSKHIGGKVTDATYGAPNSEGKRESLLERGELSIDKEVTNRFYLVMKHPGMFTALLPQLKHRFQCYAIIRNPLAVMASRSSMGRRLDGSTDGTTQQNTPRDASSWKGTTAHMFDEDLRRQMAPMVGGTFEWNLMMLDWACERYKQYLPEDHIVRYEDIIASRGKALSAIVPSASELDEPMESKNLNPLYDREIMLEVGERLLESEGAYWHFYTRESVEDLLNEIS
jgi:hypothetical protein